MPEAAKPAAMLGVIERLEKVRGIGTEPGRGHLVHHARLGDVAQLFETMDAIFGLFQCGDGRWVRLHTNFPHHRDGVLRVLGGIPHDREAVSKALQSRKASDFEDVCAEAGLVVTMARSFAEWDAHLQGQAVANIPPIIIERIGDAPPQPLSAGQHSPLAGVRVLEMTRAVAGPVAGRALASHGADVMLITAPHLPFILPLAVDTGRGKLSAQLDLRDAASRETLRGLARHADIFLQGYRPGAIAGHGFYGRAGRA